MKKSLLLAFSFIVIAFSSSPAKEVTKENARKVAINAYFEKINQFDRALDYEHIIITNDFTRYLNNDPVYYAFDFASGGFMIIAADDAYDPVIGYSFDGVFPKEKHAYVYQSFMQSYVDQIQYIRENNITAEPLITDTWKHYSTHDISTLNPNRGGRDVDPLLTNMWNQDDPYNLLCPEDNNGPGGHAYVGCVATALSMIMHYYRYPETGSGDHCYMPSSNPQYGQQCADFGATTYAWDGMQDNIDKFFPWPVAEIGYHCAVAVNMDFGPDGSGVSFNFNPLIPNRLDVFFSYSDAQYLLKSSYTQTAWINMLQDQIDDAQPVYYSGFSTDGGHAFVCDGYQDDDFHFNFGWSGSGNGYYSLVNVGGFYINQNAIRDFYPTDPSYPYYASGLNVITHPSGQFTDGSGPLEDYLPNTDASWLIDPQTEEDSITDIKLYFIDFALGAGDYLRVYDGETTNDSLLGEFTGNTLPGTIFSTGNKMLISLISDGSSEGAGFKAEFDANPAEFCDGIVTITEPVGTFSDGSGDFNYSSGSQCMFKIDPPFANTITLTFTEFETEEDKDLVMVYDENQELGTFSGSENPGSFTITGDFAFIAFSTNATHNFSGWEITYEIDNVGVQEKESFTNLNIYPNPATNALQVDFSSAISQTIEMRLVNVTGDAIYSSTMANVSGAISKSIDVSDFAKGIYILNLSSAEGSVNKKVIIK
jgi:hypothetical protein